VIKLGIGNSYRFSSLTLEDEGGAIIPVAKQIFGKIEAGALKPFSVEHPLGRGDNSIIGF